MVTKTVCGNVLSLLKVLFRLKKQTINVLKLITLILEEIFKKFKCNFIFCLIWYFTISVLYFAVQ